MTPQQAEVWAQLFQAIASGKTLQSLQISGDDGRDYWQDCRNYDRLMLAHPGRYRIKPEPITRWYRVARFSPVAGVRDLSIAESETEELNFEKNHAFIEWLTDRIVYELSPSPKGE